MIDMMGEHVAYMTILGDMYRCSDALITEGKTMPKRPVGPFNLQLRQIALIDDIHQAISTCIMRQIALWTCTHQNAHEYAQRCAVEKTYQDTIDMLRQVKHNEEQYLLRLAQEAGTGTVAIEERIAFYTQAIVAIRDGMPWSLAREEVLERLKYDHELHVRYLLFIRANTQNEATSCA